LHSQISFAAEAENAVSIMRNSACSCTVLDAANAQTVGAQALIDGARTAPKMSAASDSVRNLVGMGFDENRVRQALQASNNDMDLALDRWA